MAVKSNVITDPNGSSSRLYVGVAAFRVTHINPTQEELKTLGFKADKTPVYRDEKNGTRIALFLEAVAPGGNKIKTNTAFFIKPDKVEGLFMNKQLKFAKDRSKLSGEIRQPYFGEIEFLKFLQVWANTPMDEELCIDSIGDVAQHGDIREIRSIYSSLKEGYFKALCIVSEGKYQNVYNRKFERANICNYFRLHKSIVDNWNFIKDKDGLGGIDPKLFIEEQFMLRPWTGDTAALAMAAKHSANGNGNGAHKEHSSEDDAPF
jgi:hypothetical protein